MGIKTKLGMAMATSAAGIAMIAGGSFAIFTAQANTGWQNLKAGTVKLAESTGDWTQVTDGITNPDTDNWSVTNLEPGDTQTQELTFTNTGSLHEWVKIDTNVMGDLFQDNGVTGNTLGQGTNGAGQQDWISKDYVPTGNSDAFMFDNHPAWYSYVAYVENSDGSGKTQIASQGQTSVSTTNGVYELESGKKLVIDYTLRLPIAAHNDYQGASGKIGVQVDAVQHSNIDGSLQNPDLNDMHIGQTYYDGSVNQGALQPQQDQYANNPLN